MKHKRMNHRLVLIDDNIALIIGGYNHESLTLNSVELFDIG